MLPTGGTARAGPEGALPLSVFLRLRGRLSGCAAATILAARREGGTACLPACLPARLRRGAGRREGGSVSRCASACGRRGGGGGAASLLPGPCLRRRSLREGCVCVCGGWPLSRQEQRPRAMLGSGFKAERLRVNLRLVINRLKLLEKKKTELAQKARKEIADYLAAGKDERARIRVEHIIREDYLVEAMEILELYCDLLLARFGLIHSMKELDSGLAEAVSTLIWAAPRLQSEVAELKIVADQLCAKYSKEYGKLCRSNQIGTVNDRLMHKLSVEAPPKILVERYLIEIAKNYNVPYEPDSVVMAEAPAGVEADLIDVGFVDDVKKGGRGGGGGGSGGFIAPLTGPDGIVPMPMPSPAPPFSYPPPKGLDFNGLPVGTYQPFPSLHPPQIPATPPMYESIDDVSAGKDEASRVAGPGPKPEVVAKPPSLHDNFVLPELPSVPDTLPAASAGVSTSASEDIDFDDLSRRFEELKKKT
ncbi:IST1 homolog [Paroedura picta]|uniref:IST1 homolog n=1 Tax=Paroedura picta TaxID=143630 RepID=UPI0040566D91